MIAATLLLVLTIFSTTAIDWGFWRNMFRLPNTTDAGAPVVRLSKSDLHALVTRELPPTPFEEMPARSSSFDTGTARPSGVPDVANFKVVNGFADFYEVLPPPQRDEQYVIDEISLVSHCPGPPAPQEVYFLADLAAAADRSRFALFGLDIATLATPHVWRPREPYPLPRGLPLLMQTRLAHTGFIVVVVHFWNVKGQG